MDKDNDSRLSLGEYDAMMQQGAAGASGNEENLRNGQSFKNE
jgi:hypothetical protein